MNEEMINALRSVLKEELSPVTERLDKIEGKLEAQDGRLNNIEGKLVAQNERLNMIEGKLVAQDERLNNIESKLETQDKRLNKMDGKLDAVMEQVAYNTEIITEIQKTQERHELTLDILSRRSIDQEAELRRIQ